MKTNKLLKILSAATIISTIAVVDYSTTANNSKVTLAADTQNPEVEVDGKLMHAYENRPSMGNASLVKTTVQKVNNGYKYKVIWKDISYMGITGGIGNFWINGEEVPLKSIELPGILNPKVAEFTLPTLESRIPVEVFVEAMDKIMHGGGKQRAFLQIETKGLKEKLTSKTPETAPASNSGTTQPTTLAKPDETESVPSAADSRGTPSNSNITNNTGSTTPKPTATPRPNTPDNVNPSDKPQGLVESPTQPKVTTPTPNHTPAATATFYKGVEATLLHAYQAGKKSMGDAALEHSNVTVYKEGSTYHYIVRFHNISVGTFNDGITGFWVNGTEYPVNPTGGANKQVEVHFTSSEKLSSVPVSVFVQAMESIMPGGGKQNAILSFDWSKVTEEQGQPIAGGNPGSSGYTPTPSSSNPSTNTGGQPTSPITTSTTSALPAATQGQGVEVPVTFYDNVTATLLNAYEAGRASMGNAALDGITVFKHGDTYHYKVRFHDIKVGTLTDGITRFWVKGTEYPVVKTGGAMNQVEIHFTSTEKLTNIPVSVFVPTMESIMPGGGKKDAILSLNWSNATERQGTAVIDGGQPGASAAGNGAGASTPKGGRLNNGRLSNTGLETSSSILAGALTLMSAFMVGRRKQQK